MFVNLGGFLIWLGVATAVSPGASYACWLAMVDYPRILLRFGAMDLAAEQLGNLTT